MSKFKISKLSFILILVAIIFAVWSLYYINSKMPQVVSYRDTVGSSSTTTGNGSAADASKNPVASSTPAEPGVLNLPIPFTSQAPTANWDLEHNEDCEEASALMANSYLSRNTSATLPAAAVESEMTALNNWEDQNLGYHLDTTAEETAQMIQSYYGLQAKVYSDYTFQDIKDQISQHHVVIIPVNGQIIGNPNYTAPGPIYHMLVVRGYTANGLITNDSGTRRGQNYPYTFETLHNAGADWDHTTNTIDQNKKPMIVVGKQ